MAEEQTNSNSEKPTKKFKMIETPRHLEAFEYYFNLGVKRTLVKVAEKFQVSEQSAVKWSRAHDWQRRIEERDQKLAQALAAKNDKLILKTREDYRREIQDSLKIIRAALATVIQGLKDKKIKAKTITDIDRLVSAQDKMARLDLTLMGELPDEEDSKSVRFSFAPPTGHNSKKSEENKKDIDSVENADKVKDE
jgi:hypothetical protein